MGLDTHLTAEEMSRLSEKVPRWFLTSKSIVDIRALRGIFQGVSIEVSHAPWEIGDVEGNRYEISARVNDTNLGEYSYKTETYDTKLRGQHAPDSVEGEVIVRDTFDKIWNNYRDNRERLKQEDIAYARGLLLPGSSPSAQSL